jgi:hypothetical protein
MLLQKDISRSLMRKQDMHDSLQKCTLPKRNIIPIWLNILAQKILNITFVMVNLTCSEINVQPVQPFKNVPAKINVLSNKACLTTKIFKVCATNHLLREWTDKTYQDKKNRAITTIGFLFYQHSIPIF